MAPGANSSPPPVPGNTTPVFHVVADGAAQGPYSLEVLREQVASGRLKPETLVWSPQMSEWQAASSVESLSEIWGTSKDTPPPVPSA